MAATVLVGHLGHSWRERVADLAVRRPVLHLDPRVADHGPAGRIALLQNGKVVAWSFIGSLDPCRNPLAWLAGLMQLLQVAGDHPVIEMPPWRPAPVYRLLLTSALRLIQTSEILVTAEVPLETVAWPLGPSIVDSHPDHPELVVHAKRRSEWIRLFERCENHVVRIHDVVCEGARLGSGTRLTYDTVESLGLSKTVYGEVFGSTLLHVGEEEPLEAISAALDAVGAARSLHVEPDGYDRLLCSFANDQGQDFGIGVIDRMEWDRGTVHIVCDAVAPAPVKVLKLGSLFVDPSGKELGESKAWQG